MWGFHPLGLSAELTTQYIILNLNLTLQHQARSHWLGWSGVNLTTLCNIDLVNSVMLQTDLTIL